jgi:hypothetical protein
MGRSAASPVGQVFRPPGFWNISEKFGRFYRRFVASPIPPIILIDVVTFRRTGRIDMNTTMLARFFALSGAAMRLGTAPGFAAGGVHCQDVPKEIPDRRGGKNAQALESLLDCNRFGISPADAALPGTTAPSRPAY